MNLFSPICCGGGVDSESHLYRDLFIPARRRRKILEMLRKLNDFSVEITVWNNSLGDKILLLKNETSEGTVYHEFSELIPETCHFVNGNDRKSVGKIRENNLYFAV